MRFVLMFLMTVFLENVFAMYALSMDQDVSSAQRYRYAVNCQTDDFLKNSQYKNSLNNPVILLSRAEFKETLEFANSKLKKAIEQNNENSLERAAEACYQIDSVTFGFSLPCFDQFGKPVDLELIEKLCNDFGY